MNLRKVFGVATASALVAIPVPVIGPITGFIVGGVGAAVHELSKGGDDKNKKHFPKP